MAGRIIFVGVHNKPGMEPLDSRTKSGKIIDEVANVLRHKGGEVKKTNLFDCDTLPEKRHMGEWVLDWIERVSLSRHDIIVLLGDTVKEQFPNLPVKTYSVPHPASRRIKKDEYVKDLINKILNT